MNFGMIRYVLGYALKAEAAALVLPILCGLIYREQVYSLLIAAAVALAGGLALGFRKPHRTVFDAREGFVICALSWILMSLIGALPFWLSGAIPSYVDALFEIVSGFTTTGASILSEVEHLGKTLLFWRSFSHWLGGMGVLVLVLTILPLGGGYNMMIMKAESAGPEVSKVVPRVADTAKALYGIYIFMTLGIIAVFALSGMPLYDSLCIGFGSAGTGGFAVRNSGMADYGMFSQFLIAIAMVLFGVNFNLYYSLERRKWKEALHFEEVRVYFAIILVATAFIAASIYNDCGENLLQALYHSFFTVTSVITTTGFATLDFSLWSQPAQMILLFLMYSGACAGSTGGGMKVSRLIILTKEVFRELHVLIHPESVRHIRLGGRRVDDNVLRSVNSFLVMYVGLFIVSAFVVSFDGFDFTTTYSAVAATLNNIGPGLAGVGPYANFGGFSVLSKLVLIFDMLAGRLELLPMLMLLSPRLWQRTR